MNKFLGIISFSFIINHVLLCQLTFSIETDKQTYDYGETINIYITAHNNTSEDTVLEFSSSCQSAYYIDDYYSMKDMACFTALTYATILADSNYTWNSQYPIFPSSDYELTFGAYYITGEVLGYGFTDSIEIFINPISTVNERSVILRNTNLFQNYPNPFNSSTTILFHLSKPDMIALEVYNMTGQKIATLIHQYLDTGAHEFFWQAAELPSGTYFFRLITEKSIIIKKLILIK